MSKRYLLVVMAALAVLLPVVGSIPGGNARATEVLGTSGPPIRIEAREGRLIKLDRPAETVFIADAAIADVQVKTAQLIYIFGKRAGETTLYAVDAEENVLLNRAVVVSHNLSQLRQSLVGLLPGQDIRVRSVDNRIVLSGSATSAAAAEDARRLASSFVKSAKSVINQIDIDSPMQINLRVRIAEMSRTTSKQLGFNWDITARTGNFILGLSTGVPTTSAGLPFLPLQDLAGPANNTLISRPTTGDAVTTSFNNGTTEVNSLIDALDDQGLVKVLAEPNLTALSGETASFLAGGEFPVPVPQENNVITISFKKFGVGLSFTPTLVSDSRINVKVAPEVSQLSNAGSITLNGFTVPALTVRRAETTIELGSGQSFAIAGLLQNNSNYDVSAIPWLGDVPILGELFKSHTFRRDETELIIIVTPYVVKPISERRIVSAAPPSEDGESEEVPAQDGDQSGQPQQSRSAVPPTTTGQSRRLVGPAGFVLE